MTAKNESVLQCRRQQLEAISKMSSSHCICQIVTICMWLWRGCLVLQEADYAVPGSVYYSEYIYATASTPMPYDGAENVPTENSTAWHKFCCRFIHHCKTLLFFAL